MRSISEISEIFLGVLVCLLLWAIILYVAPFLVLFAMFYAFGVEAEKEGDKIVSRCTTKNFWLAWFYSPISFPAFLGYMLKKIQRGV